MTLACIRCIVLANCSSMSLDPLGMPWGQHAATACSYWRAADGMLRAAEGESLCCKCCQILQEGNMHLMQQRYLSAGATLGCSSSK